MGLASCQAMSATLLFQSTHPVWDGTCRWYQNQRRCCHFNPPIPCGMGHPVRYSHVARADISIHPSRVGWDLPGKAMSMLRKYFNPPIPCGMGHLSIFDHRLLSDISIHPSRVGWDAEVVDLQTIYFISIHPSRVGWDNHSWRLSCGLIYFNPPIPCGMGPDVIDKIAQAFGFQSTHPVWDGTHLLDQCFTNVLISIHPSRVGWDL